MRNPRLAKFGLLLAGSLAGCLLGEIVVRTFWPQIFERHPPGMYSEDPEVGYVLTPGFTGKLERSEFSITFTTGREGLRGGDLRARGPETVRILLLGDSQVWGFGVEDDQTVSHQLEGLLAERYPGLDVQVLNAGGPGYGTADEVNYLRARGEALDPDLVVLTFLPVNDFHENRSPAVTWAEVEDGYLVHRAGIAEPDSRPVLLRLKSWLKLNSHVARLASDALGYAALRGGLLRWAGSFWETGEGFTARDKETAVELLIGAGRAAADLGAGVLFVYTTGQDRVLSESYEAGRSQLVVAEAARAVGAHWIDATPGLRSHPERRTLFYPRDGHWTAAGHRAVADILCREIVSLGLVERPQAGD